MISVTIQSIHDAAKVPFYHTASSKWLSVMRKTHPTARPIDHDTRNRFTIGRLTIAEGLINQIAQIVGGETEARFRLGEVVHLHARGFGGQISIEDRALNEHVLREYRLRGTSHVVLSRHNIEGTAVEIVTHLGNRTTTVRLGSLSHRTPVTASETSDA